MNLSAKIQKYSETTTGFGIFYLVLLINGLFCLVFGVSESHRGLVAVVIDGAAGAIRQHQCEFAVEQHTFVATLAGADVQRAGAVGPGKDDV